MTNIINLDSHRADLIVSSRPIVRESGVYIYWMILGRNPERVYITTSTLSSARGVEKALFTRPALINDPSHPHKGWYRCEGYTVDASLYGEGDNSCA